MPAKNNTLPDLQRGIELADDTVKAAVPGHVDLPEKVLQFGTGAFLRGFADYFIDEANRQGRFGGRVVVVGSTGSGRAARLNDQDGLYTVCIQGLADGEPVQQCRIVGAVSRALSSQERWDDVLACAKNPDLSLVISNTTEVGITLEEDDRIDLDPPHSFPGKLTAFLYERARAFDYDLGRGLIILPCELIEQNGAALRRIVLTLAEQWQLGNRFLQWLQEANMFCNTLVDRIVPGAPDDEALKAMWEQVGYRDDLLILAEPYALWAIEADDKVHAQLPIASENSGIIVTGDISPYRERKVRVLNGTHSVMVPLALLCGNETVRDATEHKDTGEFIRRVMFEEIVPSLSIDSEMAHSFAHEVLDRFANPFIRHQLLDITFQQTTKMRVRVLPSLLSHYSRQEKLPPFLTLGMAAYLYYVRQGRPSRRDDQAEVVRQHWQEGRSIDESIDRILADTELWGEDLSASVPPLADAVAALIERFDTDGVRETVSMQLDSAREGSSKAHAS